MGEQILRLISAIRKIILIAALVLALPALAFALTPIARWDVVPRQTIEHGGSLNIGVVAFSKAGIDDVEFTISGQGYSGGTKTASAMALNTEVAGTVTTTSSTVPSYSWSGVWEYYVTVSASEFTSNGEITISAVVTGSDAGTRSLSAIPLYAEGASAETQYEAWVDIAGSDGTGTVGDSGDPYPSIASALAAVQTANGGDVDGCTIYLAEDEYDPGAGTIVTTSQFVTIKGATGTTKENVILDEIGVIGSGDFVKFEDLLIRSTSQYDYAIQNKDYPGDVYWLNNVGLYGNSRYVSGSCPVAFGDAVAFTNSYTTHSDFGSFRAREDNLLIRNCVFYHLGDDVFQNAGIVINARADDIDPGDETDPDWNNWYNHADGYQALTTDVGTAANNRII